MIVSSSTPNLKAELFTLYLFYFHSEGLKAPG